MTTSNRDVEASATQQVASSARPSNFVRDIVLKDLKTNKYNGRVLSAGTERLSPHRPRQVYLPKLRTGGGVWRQDQPAL